MIGKAMRTQQEASKRRACVHGNPGQVPQQEAEAGACLHCKDVKTMNLILVVVADVSSVQHMRLY